MYIYYPDHSLSKLNHQVPRNVAMPSNSKVQENGADSTSKEPEPESSEIKRRPSTDKISVASDKEAAIVEGDVTEPPLTFRRFMVLLTLTWLVVTSVSPLFFISSSIGSILCLDLPYC
jgi:hypothetical protein